MVWEIVVIIGLILLNGFFAMAEMALVSARRGRLDQSARDGDAGARLAVALKEDPSRFLSTVQVGITLIGIFAGAYGGATLTERLAAGLEGVALVQGHEEAVAMAVVVAAITFGSLILGELVPKRVALAHAETIARRVARPMSLLARAALPLVWLLKLSMEAVLRLLRVPPSAGTVVTEEEIRALIAEGAEAGVVHAAEREMLDDVMRLADQTVRAIMTPRLDVVRLAPGERLDAVRRLIRESGHSRFPVIDPDSDEILGILHAKDVAAAGADADPLALLRPALVVPDGMPVLRLLDRFKETAVHIAVVVDEYGTFEGIVTPTDILAGIAGELPEHGQDYDPQIVRRADGSLLISGRTPLHDVEEAMALRDLGRGRDYHTLAGFVLDRLGHVPSVGESVTHDGVIFEVVDMDGRRIDKLLVRRQE